MSSKIRKIVLYSTSAVLLLLYVYILYISLDISTASDEYRMFYIDETLKYCLYEDGFKNYYSTDTELVYTPEGYVRNQGYGWGPKGDIGTWCGDNSSYLYFYVTDLSKDYYFTINIVDDVGYDNQLIVNDNNCGNLVFEDNTASVKVPSDYLTEGLNTFIIYTEEAVQPLYVIRPETEDPHQYKLLVYSVILESE